MTREKEEINIIVSNKEITGSFMSIVLGNERQSTDNFICAADTTFEAFARKRNKKLSNLETLLAATLSVR